MKIPMLLRFSLYGFLKNQRYFEPFLVLMLLDDRGFSFFLVGTLIGFRELTVILLEIPSGAIADACGRRGSMVLSFIAYIVGFLVFGLAANTVAIFSAMLLLGVGDAFRSGTHKAMIFEWLRRENRTDERTRIYGYTRSWSKIGSAVSGLLAGLFVVLTDNYTYVFFFATVPYVLNVVNFLGYPKELDGEHAKARSPAEVVRHLREALKAAVRSRPLARLVGESMGYEGVFLAVKDYLQPVLQALVLTGLALPLAQHLSEKQQTAVIVGPLHSVLFLIAAFASRNAYRAAEAAGDEARAARWLWGMGAGGYLLLTWTAWHGFLVWAIVLFVVLHALQNVWRPILISRFDAHSSESQGATVLSIESQAKRGATVVVAPLLGWAVDTVKLHGPGGEFWPVGVVGAVSALVFFCTARKKSGTVA